MKNMEFGLGLQEGLDVERGKTVVIVGGSGGLK